MTEKEDTVKKCMYSNDNFTDEDRKTLCEDCEEECLHRPFNNNLEEEIRRCIYYQYEDLDGVAVKGATAYISVEDVAYIARHFAQWQKRKDEKAMETADKAYFESCNKIRQQMIDKACKYLYLHCNEVKTEDNGIAGWIDNEFINNFRKEMED